MRTVLVRWSDSCSWSGWHDKASIEREPETVHNCCTVGILINEKDGVITVAQSVSPSSYGDLITIPKSSIKKVYTLRVSK